MLTFLNTLTDIKDILYVAHQRVYKEIFTLINIKAIQIKEPSLLSWAKYSLE